MVITPSEDPTSKNHETAGNNDLTTTNNLDHTDVHIPDVNTSDDKTTATEQGEEINQTNATTHEEETKKEILKRVKKLPFMRLVKEIACNLEPQFVNKRWSLRALEALQEASEAFLIDMFEISHGYAAREGRETLVTGDMEAVQTMLLEWRVLGPPRL